MQNYNTLSLYSNNQTVYDFKDKVENSQSLVSSSINSAVLNNATNSVSTLSNTAKNNLPEHPTEELTKELYSKAINSSESYGISYKYIKDPAKYKYVSFTGGTIYKSFDGDILSNKEPSTDGWVTPDYSSGKYAIVSNDEKSLIVATSDIKPKEIVESFQPLYDVLTNQQYKSINQLKNDTKTLASYVVTNKNNASNVLNNTNNLGMCETAYSLASNALDANTQAQSTVDTIKNDTTNAINTTNAEIEMSGVAQFTPADASEALVCNANTIDRTYSSDGSIAHEGNIKTNQVANSKGNTSSSKTKQVEQTAISNINIDGVQAILYACPTNNIKSTINDANANTVGTSNDIYKQMLTCYQTPDNITYSATGEYESQTPRGGQVPFYIYNKAGAINISFTFKWHISEIQADKNNILKSIQNIARVAEDLTRPWEINNSVVPKVCRVILPGLSRIGYITSANISLYGDMTDGVSDKSDTRVDHITGENITDALSYQKAVNNYFYSQIEVAFEMAVINDVTLIPTDKIYNSDIERAIGLDQEGNFIFDPSEWDKINNTNSTNFSSNNDKNFTSAKLNKSSLQNTLPIVKDNVKKLNDQAMLEQQSILVSNDVTPFGMM
jgi:hypothetical protein